MTHSLGWRKGSPLLLFYVNNTDLEESVRERGGRDAGGRTKEGVKSSGSWSQCFGEKDIKDEGRCCEGGNADGR